MTKALLRSSVPLAFALAMTAITGSVAAAPSSPLGVWMKSNMGTSLAGQDFPTLKKNFDFLAGKPPPGGDFPEWPALAKAGLAAAAKEDLAGVKAACKGCHDAYKAKYKKDFATQPFP